MRIEFHIQKLKISSVKHVEWFIELDEDEIKYGKEIKEEMDLNMKEQFGGYKIY